MTMGSQLEYAPAFANTSASSADREVEHDGQPNNAEKNNSWNRLSAWLRPR